MFSIRYSGTLVPELNSFYNSGQKPTWMRTESNFPIRLTLNLNSEFDSVLIQFSSQPELWNKICEPSITVLAPQVLPVVFAYASKLGYELGLHAGCDSTFL